MGDGAIMGQWLQWLMQQLEAMGTPAGWIAAIIQLAGYVVGGPIVLRRFRRRVADLEREIADRDNDLAKAKDSAYARWMMLREAVRLMKARAPKLYRDFLEPYGGEDAIANWWSLPPSPIEFENPPRVEVASEKTGGSRTHGRS